MKKFLLKTSLAIAALLASIFTSAGASEMNSDFTVDSIAYAVLSHEPATVTVVWCYKQNLGDITIPQTINALNSVTGTRGFKVTAIDNYVFENCKTLTSIKLPASIETIGTLAFDRCVNLKSVSFYGGTPELRKISSKAFYKCESLETFEFPNSLEEIGSSAFEGCSSLTGDLIIPNSVTIIGEKAFNGCSGLTSVSIGSSVTSIGSYAFSGCNGLTNLILEDGEDAISGLSFPDSPLETLYLGRTTSDAFAKGKTSLKTLTIGDKVTSIANSAFDGCSGLTGDLTIPNSVTSIGSYAFWDCSGLNGNLTLGNSVTEIGFAALYQCSDLTGDLTIPNSVTSIGHYAFYNCSGLNGNLTLGNSVTEIGSYTFYNCSGLTGDLTIPNSVTEIGDYTFYNCCGLTGNLTIPNSVTEIGDYAFHCCSGLIGDLTIPNSVTSIGISAFLGCSGLNGNLTLGNSVTSIGRDAFYNCRGLTGNLTIPNSVTEIGDYTFYNCCGLTGNLTIPNSVTSIGRDAFHSCCGLTSVTVGNSVTSIGSYAFYNCSGLTKVNITDLSAYCNIGEYAFNGCRGLTEVNITDLSAWCKISFGNRNANPLNYADHFKLNGTEITDMVIPDDVISIKAYAFWDCDSLTSVTIGNSVTSIGNDAFWDCDGLTSITIGNSVTSIGSYAFDGCRSLTVNITDLSAWCKISFWDREAIPVNHLILNGTEIIDLVIPDDITEIKDCAFDGCSWLTSVTIPNSVTSIGNNAFYNCTGLTSVTSLNTEPPVCGASTFKGVPAECPLYVPSESKELYAAATGWSQFSNIIGLDDVKVDIQGDNATFEIPTTEGAATYTVNVYSDEAMTQLVATTNYDAAGNIIPMSTSLELSIDGFENGTYYYDVIAKSESGETLNNYTGSFEIVTSGISNVGSDDTATEVARYDIHGRLLSAPAKGINIVKYSDGTVKKIVIN